MKLIYRIAHFYNQFRLIMWLGGLATTLLLPLLSYGFEALGVFKRKRELLADDPETALEQHVPNAFGFITDNTVLTKVAQVCLIAGILFIVCLIVMQVFSFITRRTKLSGVDKDARKLEREDREADAEDSDVNDEDDSQYDDFGDI